MMEKGMVSRFRRLLSPPTSIRWRLFGLLGGVSLGMLLVANLFWLPGTIYDIREAQSELQRVAVRGVRDRIHFFMYDKEDELRSLAKLFRPPLLMHDQEALRLLVHRFFQREPTF